MPGEARSPMNSCWQTPTKTTRTKTEIKMSLSTRGHCGLNIFVVIAIFGLPVFLSVNAVPYGRTQQRTLRLCSKSLSDALYLVCRERGGYNEPFSYSIEDEARSAPTGPGLVEECCYRPCSYEQLEQYCKPNADEKTNNSQDGIKESLRIVNLPYSSPKEMVSEKRATARNEHNERDMNKSKDRKVTRLKDRATRIDRKHAEKYQAQRGCKRMKIAGEAERKRFMRDQFRVDVGKNDQRADYEIDDADNAYVRVRSRQVCRRHRRRKHPRRGKALREAATANVPGFNVGTTLPEPKDSVLLMFPSRVNIGFQRASNNLSENGDYATREKPIFSAGIIAKTTSSMTRIANSYFDLLSRPKSVRG